MKTREMYKVKMQTIQKSSRGEDPDKFIPFSNSADCGISTQPVKEANLTIVPQVATPVVALTPEAEITKLYDEILDYSRKTLEGAIRIGELCALRKEELAHGDFLPWLRKETPLSEDFAERCMTIYRGRNEIPHGKIQNITQALAFLKKVSLTVKKEQDLLDEKTPTPELEEQEQINDEKRLQEQAQQEEKKQLLQTLEIAPNSANCGIQPDPSAGIVDKSLIEAANKAVKDGDFQPWADLVGESFKAWTAQWGKIGGGHCAAFVMVEAIAWAKKQEVTDLEVILEDILKDWKG